MYVYKWPFCIPQTKKIAERICETSREVVALGKATFYAQMSLERKEAYR